MIRVVHIANNSAYENNPISKAFRDEGFSVTEIDFVRCLQEHRMKPKRFAKYVLEVITNIRPNFVFMQIQHSGVIDYEDAWYINQIAPLISWSGDVRNDTDWHELMGKAGVLTLLNNDEDIEKLRGLGYKADYLQVSFHTDIHNPKNRADNKQGKIVFLGTNYGVNAYPLSSERIDLCIALRSEFGDDFAVYGRNWEQVGIPAFPIPSHSSSLTYSAYDIAINHSHYQRSRYSSDRLFYILGSGTFCLSQWYPRIEEEFIDGKHLVIYKDIPDLIKKCKYWLHPDNSDRRNQIAKAGCEYVHNECTWNHRIKDLIHIINKYYPETMTKNDDWIEALYRVSPEKAYSQFGEEAFIGHIFNNIGTTNKYFVDLGAGDGHNLSNTKLFKETYGWNGLMVDADNHGNNEVKQEFITATNILEILDKYKVPSDFDFLSIDLDGNDWYVLSELLSLYKPRLIMAEFNGTIPLGVDKVMAYNEKHTWNNDDYYGASFDAFKRLGKLKGYVTIFSYASTNIYMIHRDELQNPDKEYNVTYIPQQYHAHNPTGEWITFI